VGVQTKLTLTEANKLFKELEFVKLLPTQDGVMDTTYIAKTTEGAHYILKKYERDIPEKITFEVKLLLSLHQQGLNVPLLLRKEKEWYLYTKLSGKSPKHPQLFHLRQLGRFVAKMHQVTQHYNSSTDFFDNYTLEAILRQQKTKHFYYYKKLLTLTQHQKGALDGFIHGDIFMDNTLFEAQKVALFDFVDGGNGSFAFELGVIALSFNLKRRKSFYRILLQSYNQHAPRKISQCQLDKGLQKAAQLYTLLRLNRQGSTEKVKELVKFC
jgi:homoserine kinase type II